MESDGHLELDRKAQADLLLLAHPGLAGCCEANEILWELLTMWALKPDDSIVSPSFLFQVCGVFFLQIFC